MPPKSKRIKKATFIPPGTSKVYEYHRNKEGKEEGKIYLNGELLQFERCSGKKSKHNKASTIPHAKYEIEQQVQNQQPNDELLSPSWDHLVDLDLDFAQSPQPDDVTPMFTSSQSQSNEQNDEAYDELDMFFYTYD
ncbi:hypothetical protein GPJ56_007860 [Histomonas meleagridis]|uniref:uncharacterized protein n=1 Tax=Histomonas meleagridis TaxID=135588 RepID=UPI003559BBC7|nr:hypothetical protein GPJ56_007860 [Histomonas meleagridis]KAH0804080.1 hypothetical protein GO595_002910 [Histomonas meleagridis]